MASNSIDEEKLKLAEAKIERLVADLKEWAADLKDATHVLRDVARDKELPEEVRKELMTDSRVRIDRAKRECIEVEKDINRLRDIVHRDEMRGAGGTLSKGAGLYIHSCLSKIC